MLGPEPQNNGLAVRRLAPGGQGELGSVAKDHFAVFDGGGKEVHLRAAEETGHEARCRPLKQIKRRAELFIEQEEQRVAHDRAADRDTLALTAGKLTWKSFEKLRNAEHFGGTLHAFVDLGGCNSPRPQAECNVFIDIEIGIERVILENHRDVAIAWACPRNIFSADFNRAAAGFLEPCDGAEQA